MGSLTAFSGHVVLLSPPGWGHLRPLCAFATKVVKERQDFVVTLLLAGDFSKRSEDEINKYFSSCEADSRAKENIRVVNYCEEMLDALRMMPLMIRDFPAYYDKLLNCQPIRCHQTQRTFDAVRKPNAVVLDFLLLPILQHIRSVTGKSIPVYASITPCASWILRITAPEKYGGFGDVASKARTQAEATGRKYEEILIELCDPTEGNLVKVPGLPPLYDWEWSPQKPTEEFPQIELVTFSPTFANECDGYVTTSCAAFEPESLDAMRTWLGETNRPLYVVGPLVPPIPRNGVLSDVVRQTEKDSSKNGEECYAFLENTLKIHGERSIIYISFGTFWFPPKVEHLWALVDILLELKFPFILAHASEKSASAMPPGYAEKIQKSGIGFLSPWCPQLTILSHPATGWFITHCGQSSWTESLIHGKPMIAWPLKGDQACNAVHLTLNLDVAFELIEVRDGPGLKPLYRGVQPRGTLEAVIEEARDVLQRARGPEGERKRRNAESLQEKSRKEWGEGGEALANLRKFLTENCSES